MPSPGWLRRTDLPVDAAGRSYIDPANLDQILDQFANWRDHVNAGAKNLTNLGFVSFAAAAAINAPVVFNGGSDTANYQATFLHGAAGSQRAGCNFRINDVDLWQLVADNSDGNKFKLRNGNTTDIITVASIGFSTPFVGFGTTVPEGALHINGINTAGVNPFTGILLDRSYDAVGDCIDIVYGGGSGFAGNRVGRLSMNATAGGQSGFIFYCQQGAGDGYNYECMRITGAREFHVGTGTDFFFANYLSGVGAAIGYWTGSAFGLLRIHGNIAAMDLPGTNPGAGTKRLWYDPTDGNRVKYAP